MRGETTTPRRVSAALLDDRDKGTWNLSIYCNRSGRPSIAHVTSRDPTLDPEGRAPARSGVACSKNVQRQYGGPRNTRKDAKGDERCGLGGIHIARPDIGRGRDALLRDPAWQVQKTCNGNI